MAKTRYKLYTLSKYNQKHIAKFDIIDTKLDIPVDLKNNRLYTLS